MACGAGSVKARHTYLDARRRLHEAGVSLVVDTGRGVVASAGRRRLCPGVRGATCLAGGAPAQVRRSVATGIPHTLRHCYASSALANGIPITEVSRWLGYKSIEVTHRIYGTSCRLRWSVRGPSWTACDLPGAAASRRTTRAESVLALGRP